MIPRAKFGALTLLLNLLATVPAAAHPMGNFSINHYARISVNNGEVELRYVLDLAEIPTYQEMQRTGIDPQSDAAAISRYLAEQSEGLRRGLQLRIAARHLVLTEVAHQILFSPGAGDLPTMKMGFTFRALLPRTAGTQTLEYADENFHERTGWKEIVCASEILPGSSGCGPERSRELSTYPVDLINSPPQDTEAKLRFAIGAPSGLTKFQVPALASAVNASPNKAAETRPALALRPNPQGTPRSAFTALIAREGAGPWFFLFAALIALGLGALHALEPGHGKTMVAAYLVGSRGTPTHAVLLGLVVTAAHTAGVYLLGGITLYASRYFLPEQVYPWLGLISGLMIAGLGVFLLLQRWSGQSFEHDHGEGGAHRHWFTKRKSAVDLEPVSVPKQVTLKQLLVLGITGGMIPCPAALVVMLSAIALRRTGFGLFLIVAFGIGLAAVLIAIGLLMVYARNLLTQVRRDSQLLEKWLPLTSAAFITILGGVLAARGLSATHMLRQLSSPGAGWGAFLLTVLLGFILGIRHSTDPDHIVAVSTIVSRNRSLRNGAMIGAVWGMGHTLTIFVVGSAIILFRITIPARIGLGMEFLVALMLILLGVLNLSGLMPRLRARFFNAAPDRKLGSALTGASRSVLLRSLAVGIVHGLAGSAAVALLVLAAIHSPGWAICYLLVFGAGTIAGMMLMTSAISLPLTWRKFENAGSYLTVCSGIVSLVFGGFLVYQIGYVGGLFAANPIWTPR